MEEKLYYEDAEIINVVDAENESCNVALHDPTGNNPDIVENVMKWELNACTTKAISSPSDGRNLRAIEVVDRLYDLLKDMNIRTNEISFYIQKFLTKIEGVEGKATLNCFGKDNANDVRIGDWESKL